MKYKLYLCALLLALGATARADALNKQHISADAKWLLHLDCENLRKTKIGGFLLEKVVTPKVDQAASAFKINVSNIVSRINSVTAYGADFDKRPDAGGVLLINADTETQKALEGLLVAQILANTNGPVKKLENEEHALYSFGNEVYIAPIKGGPIVISKSQEQIGAARDLLAGKGPSLATTKTFGEFPTVANSFFFLGVAEAFNQPNAFPAQAKVLQMADGGRVALGERADQVFLNLALRGKTAEVTRQIQQVIEGMVALVSLGQPDNADLMDLAKSTKVSCVDQLVNISMEYPTAKVVAKLNDEMNPRGREEQQDKPPRQHKMKKAKKKPAAEADKQATKPEAEDSTK